MEHAVGAEVAGRYRLERPLGRGGMGTVWLAEDRVIARRVAVKVVEVPQGPPGGDLLASRQRALREARAAGRLSHPNAVTVFDVVEEPDRCAIVMELVDAPTLADLVRQDGPLPAERVAALGLQLVEVLDAAHRAGIVHRDVKPGNVMVLPGDGVKLADFGIASLHGDPQLTASGMTLGSPRYMSPEQAAGRPAGQASDWWSLGATLYFAVEGRAPFDREGTPELLAAILTQEPDPMLRAGSLRPVLSLLLARDPDERPTPAMLRRMLRPEAADPTGATAGGPAAPSREAATHTLLPTLRVGPPMATAAPAAPAGAAAGAAGHPAAPVSRRAVVLLGGLSAGLAATSVALGAVLLRGGERDGGTGGNGAGTGAPGGGTGARTTTGGAAPQTGAGPSAGAAPESGTGAAPPAGALPVADAPSSGLGAGSAGRPGLQDVTLSTAPAQGQLLPDYLKSGRNDAGGYAFGAEPLWVATTAGPVSFVELDSAFRSAFEVRVFQAGDPFERVKRDEAQFAAEHAADGYRRVDLTDRWDYAGRPAAGWEFSWTRRGERMHGRLVAFTVGPRTYTVLFRSAESWWENGATGRVTDNFERAFVPLP